jgi:dienelactone hydrolase
VTIFGHGLRGNHQHALAIANTLAATGRATIAIDAVKHGERSTCVGSAVLFQSTTPGATDDAACFDPTKQQCDREPASPTYGRCIARTGVTTPAACDHTNAMADLTCSAAGQGRCLDNDVCEGGTFRKNTDGSVTISGWNMLDLANFFVTRDNFRHQALDLAQVTRVLQGGMNASLSSEGVTVDGTRIDYVGQSLGGMLGTLYTAVSPDVHSVVLNVPGGRLTQVLDEATDPNFVAMRTALYSALASKGMPQGTPAFDTFVRSGQWIVDPGDPVNYSWYVMNGSQVPADRKALVQYITRDAIVPNSTTQALLDAANLRGGSSKLLSSIKYDPSDTELPPTSRHGFLFSSTPTAATAQSDVVQFLTP